MMLLTAALRIQGSHYPFFSGLFGGAGNLCESVSVVDFAIPASINHSQSVQ